MSRTAAKTASQFNWYPSAPDDPGPCGPALESDAFRDDLFEFIDDFIASLRNFSDLPEWYRTPVDLLEASRMELMLELRKPIRDWIAWRRLAELNASRVDLIVPGDCRSTLEADLREMRFTFDVRLCRSPKIHAAPVQQKPSAVRRAAHWLIGRTESRWLPRQEVALGNPDQSRFLFLDFHPNSTHILIPVWKQLSASRNHQCLYIAGREKVRRELTRNGIEAPNLQRCGPRVAEHALRPPQWSQLVDRYFYTLENRYSVPTPPSVRRSFELIAGYFTEIKLWALRLQRVFQRFQPDTFFVSSGLHALARIGTMLSRNGDCVSIHLQHGLFKRYKEHCDLSDVICLWGELHRRLLQTDSCNSELLVTGSPKHDELLKQYSALSQNDRPLVAFFSSRSGSWIVGSRDFEKHLAAVYDAAKNMPDVDFVVKLHPGETRATVKRLTLDPTKPANLRFTQSDDAYGLLQRCHTAMTVSSAIGYEALLFRRPLLVLNLTGHECHLPLLTPFMAAYVTQADELVAAIHRTLQNSADPVANTDDFWLNDGSALERILAHAEQRRRPRQTEAS